MFRKYIICVMRSVHTPFKFAYETEWNEFNKRKENREKEKEREENKFTIEQNTVSIE